MFKLLSTLRIWLTRHLAPVEVTVSDNRLKGIRADIFALPHEPEIADPFSAVMITPENDREFWVALRRYNTHYDNQLYIALVGDDWRLGILLQDAALSVCGSPYHAGSCSRLYRVLGQHDSDTWLNKFL